MRDRRRRDVRELSSRACCRHCPVTVFNSRGTECWNSLQSPVDTESDNGDKFWLPNNVFGFSAVFHFMQTCCLSLQMQRLSPKNHECSRSIENLKLHLSWQIRTLPARNFVAAFNQANDLIQPMIPTTVQSGVAPQQPELKIPKVEDVLSTENGDQLYKCANKQQCSPYVIFNSCDLGYHI
jgi:hypothetical protein